MVIGSGYVISRGHAASLTITVDGNTTHQTITGLGADINPNSWDGGNLKPALDKLIDEEGMKTFRVGDDMEDWESTNDDSSSSTYNWTYYNPIFDGTTSFDTNRAGSNFGNVWAVIDYLHQKGIPDSGIILSNMGIGPSWMGGASLSSGKEDEYAETMAAEAYWGYSHGHTFGYFSPNNEMDISANEGVSMSDTQWADVMNRIAVRLNNLGLTGVKILGPETCCTIGYFDAMKNYPTLMAKLDHFDFHDYTGQDYGAANAIAGTGKDFWVSEYSNPDQMFTYLDQGASGLLMWEAYDSVYNHAILNGHGSAPGNDSLSFGDTPVLAYNKTAKTYTPRTEFYEYEHLFKFVPIGSVRIGATSSSGNVRAEAFKDPVSGRVTIMGDSGDSSSDTITINLANVPSSPSYDVYQTATNSGYQFTKTATSSVSNNSVTITVAAGALFTATSTNATPTPTPSVTPTPTGTPAPTPTPTPTPTPAPGGLLVGDQTVESGGDTNPAGDAEAFKYTATGTGAASTISLYVNTGNSATGLVAGIYNDNGGHPGTLLASGTATGLTSAAWNTINLSPGTSITTGTTYWIAVLGTGGTLEFRDQTTGNCSESHNGTGLSALPPTWSSGKVWTSCLASLYVSASTSSSGKVGDINGDGAVNIFDLSILLSHWGTSDSASDLNHDGTVNIFDLSVLLSHWGT
jgi:O-glycosyl hydrolase